MKATTVDIAADEGKGDHHRKTEDLAGTRIDFTNAVPVLSGLLPDDGQTGT
jgi:hypothetical protein